MGEREPDVVAGALEAVRELMRIFRPERILYLFGAFVAFGLLGYAGFLLLEEGADLKQLGLLCGSGGLFAAVTNQVTTFKNRAFQLIEDLVRRQSGIEAAKSG